MKIRTIISSFALVSAMAISGGAAAQSMLGDVAIPQDRMGDFQEKCRAIASIQTESLSSPNDPSDDATATGSVVKNGEDDPTSSDGDVAGSDNIDSLLASMTPEQCQEAGLIDGPLPATTN